MVEDKDTAQAQAADTQPEEPRDETQAQDAGTQDEDFDEAAFNEWLKQLEKEGDTDEGEPKVQQQAEPDEDETVPDPEEVLNAILARQQELEARVEAAERLAAKAYAQQKWDRFAAKYPDAVAGPFQLKDKRVQKVMEVLYKNLINAGEDPPFEDVYEMALYKIEKGFKKSGARRSGESPVGRKPTVTEGVSAVSGKQERVARPTNIQDLVKLGVKELGKT
ncbi:MAG: hypothetical protein DRP82_01255 [Planctomycetota bacterium]|nr:MAG: hypothetical protein DRP82_01255 [Planctomycetota bacterium]